MSKVKNHNSPIIDDLFDSIDPKEMEHTKQKMLLAAKIEDAMEAKGWKKKQLIEALEIKSPSIVTRWFSGTHNFKVDTLIDLQLVLGVNLLNVVQEVEMKQQSKLLEKKWLASSNARSFVSTDINKLLMAEE